MTSSSGRILADTHTLVWYLAESPKLSAKADQLLQDAESGLLELVVPTIVLAEAMRVVERRNPGLSMEELFAGLSRFERANVVSLDMTILQAVLALPPSIEMHDRIIAATAQVYGATLISKDRQLGTVVETVW